MVVLTSRSNLLKLSFCDGVATSVGEYALNPQFNAICYAVYEHNSGGNLGK